MSSGVGVWSCGLKFVWSCDQTLLFTRRRTFSLKRHEGSSRFFHKTSWCYRTTRCMSSVEKNEKKKKEKVIVISGPTGAGKSRLALELAKRLNGEIISADSVQVYRGLDIGSAKPLPCDRKEVPHHLLDILHPSEDYSVGQFFEDARQATRNIFDNGHVPIIAGGTGLYLRWYIYGKPEVPKASLEIAAEVDSEFMLLQKNGDWDAGVQLLVKAGDSRAHDLASNDWYRLRRSLEIIKSTGSPPSAFHVPYDSYKEQLDSRISKPSSDDVSSADVSSADGLGQNPYKDLEYEYICFFLSIKRMDLYRLIDLRCEEMLLGDESILLEASSLLEMGLLPNTNSATRAIGYRQAMEYLLKCRQGGGCSPGEFYAFLSEFQKASRNFAKRQMTWFRNEKIYHWLDASQSLESVLNCILDFYNDENGTAVVPKQLRMKKDMNSRKEIYEMKSYRTKNRHFVGREDCYHILDRIRTQQ